MKTIKLTIFLLAIIALFGLAKSSLADCSGSGTTWNCTAGTTAAQVNTVLSSASDGATINFGAGSYTWNGRISVSPNKAVSLIGAGAGNSNVNITGGTIDNDAAGNITATGVYRLSGFTFSGQPGGSGLLWLYSNPGTVLTIRIDHNHFDNLDPSGSNASLALLFGSAYAPNPIGPTYGVIDHNTVTGDYNYMLVKILGVGPNVAAPASPKGTANNLFVEDNTISFTNTLNLGNGLIDCWYSGSIVFRHNSVTNNLLAAHEEGHGGGCINYEVYNNTLGRTANSGGWESGARLIHHQGSGEQFYFNNSFTAADTKAWNPLSVTDYRGCPAADTGTGLGIECDGTHPIDGNWSSPPNTYYGYPCWRQTGRMNAGSANTTGQPGTLSPLYVWNNYWSDTSEEVNLVVENPWGCAGPPTPSTHVVSDRDYYNAVSASSQTSSTSPFNGSTGMGFGTLANRPTTCTTNSLEQGGGVGYFATDQGPQGTLYRCSATNTWTVQYQPYTYPHPLTMGSSGDTTPPAAPSGFTVN